MDEAGVSGHRHAAGDWHRVEIRLRDTLLRSVNANELFAEAQATSSTPGTRTPH